MEKSLISIVMGSKSDWPVMEHASLMLDKLQIHHEVRVLSAHRTPDALFDYIKSAEKSGTEVFIAAAGGAAHLPGVVAAKTMLPVIGVPMLSASLNGMDSLLSIVQMPAGIPVGTMAIGKPGAINAALFAGSILSIKYPAIRNQIQQYRQHQAEAILANVDPRVLA